jgi:hypothetical protein
MTNRQASAVVAAESGNPAHSAALRFDSNDDAPCFAKYCVENVNRRYWACSLFVLDRYKKGELEVVLKIESMRNSRVFDLVFYAVPVDNLRNLDVCGLQSTKFGICGNADHKSNQRVFTNVTEFVEGVERIIPSFVTFERSKERLDFRWQILASTPHAIVEVGSAFPERECDAPGIGVTTGCQMSGKGSMVETGSNMLDHLCGEDAPPEWESFSELELVDFVDSVRVRISDLSVWLFTEKLVNLGYQIVQMFLCTREPAVGTIESGGVIKSHGNQTRSDERPRISEGGAPLSDHSATAA